MAGTLRVPESGIIDSHIHILPERRTASLVRWVKRAFPSHPSREDMTPEEVMADLRACGVVRAFNFVFPLKPAESDSLNEFSRDIARENPMLVPFGSMHMETPDKGGVVEQCIIDYGLAGIKLHPYVQGFEAFAEDFEPMYRRLATLRRPLFVHTGFDAFYGQRQDLEYLQGILDRYPDMPLVLVHSLFPKFKLARALMRRHEQLYLDMTNVPGTIGLYQETPQAVRDNFAAFGDELCESDDLYAILYEFSDRVMFGTDHPAGMGSVAQVYHDFDSLELSEKVRADLLRQTAATFLERHCGDWGRSRLT